MGPHDTLLDPETAPARPQAESPSPAAGSPTGNTGSDETHFFICSSDASIIDAHHETLKAGLPAYGGTAERYSCSGSDLEERERQAKATHMPFSGVSRIGPNAKSSGTMADVLRSIRIGSVGETHVEHVKVQDAGAPWVRKVYEALFSEGVSEEILPFYMHETKDDGEARFLLDSLRRIM